MGQGSTEPTIRRYERPKIPGRSNHRPGTVEEGDPRPLVSEGHCGFSREIGRA